MIFYIGLSLLIYLGLSINKFLKMLIFYKFSKANLAIGFKVFQSFSWTSMFFNRFNT
jgi:hypothetical protein